MMESKKVLVLGMLDSIHLARWLGQFENENIAFYLFPSKKFRTINPELIKLLKNRSKAEYKLMAPYYNLSKIGYIDFMLCKIIKFFGRDFRRDLLSLTLRVSTFDFIHALEIQGAGYLYASLPNELHEKNKLILTNWGSDIYFFRKDKKHNGMIDKVMRLASYYSAECQRDYNLVKNYKFSGRFLPCIPNAGGFKKNDFSPIVKVKQPRNLIICKGYGGLFGRSQIAFPAIEAALIRHINLNVYFFSVTKDVLPLVIDLISKFSTRVTYSTVERPLIRSKLMEYFGQAVVYIGCSKSDAISTSFLEALAHGVYPIQTNTSCAGEWINKGAIGSVVSLNSALIKKELLAVLANKALLNKAYRSNIVFAKQNLNYEKIQKTSKVFYQL